LIRPAFSKNTFQEAPGAFFGEIPARISSCFSTKAMPNSFLTIHENALPPELKGVTAPPRIFDIPEIPRGLIDDWIKAAAEDTLGSAHTRRNYQADIEDFEAWRNGRQITKDLITEYLGYRNEKAGHDLSPTYRQRILAALRWWVRALIGKIGSEPLPQDYWPWRDEMINQLEAVSKFAGPRGYRKKAAEAGRHIPDQEMRALLDVCRNDPDQFRGARDLAMIAVAVAAGPRVHELTDIRMSDVKLQTDSDGSGYVITVIGKGNKEADLYVEGFGAKYLADWLALRGDAPGGVFCPISHVGNPRKAARSGEWKSMTPEAARQILAKRCEQAGILAPTTWHDFRRTMIGNMIGEEDIKLAQKAARHANVSQTAAYDRRPAQETRNALRRQAERLLPTRKKESAASREAGLSKKVD
jgi:site-specific recombinase XerD